MNRTIRRTLAAALFVGVLFCLGAGARAAAHAEGSLSVSLKLGEEYFVFAGDDIEYAGDFWAEFGKQGIFDAKGRLKGFLGPVEPRYRLKDIDEKLAAIDRLVHVDPVNAEVAFRPDNPAASPITPDVPGLGLDLAAIKPAIERALLSGQSYAAEVAPVPLQAEITAADARESLSLCAEFSTSVATSTANRKTNVRLALQKWNGRSFRRGEVGSFNQIVGPRTAENGFLDAKIIVGGEFVEGVGGGVCQASTTLYNAFLLSGNSIAEKHRHSLRVSYVPPSFDAMVSSACDMKFKCEKKLLHVVSGVSGDRAYVKIYAKPNAVSIARQSVVTFEGEAPAAETIVDTAGKYADKVRYEDETYVLQRSKGELRSEGWLVYGNGRRERIRTDVYKAQVGKIVRGAQRRDALNDV